MQTRLARPMLWLGVVVCAVVLGVVNLGRVSAGTNKVEICHFQEERESWKLLSLPSSAAAAHLAQHDDAVPGGTTTQSGTLLDAACHTVVAAVCPCGNARAIVQAFFLLEFDGQPVINAGTVTGVVFYSASDQVDGTPEPPGLLLRVNTNTDIEHDSSALSCIYLMSDEQGTGGSV